jgi:UDP:flavonoid glycosyltransferase YjiC (YdhE family)
MRVLFTSSAGLGHFLPLVPTALAARAAGHDVTFACPAPLHDRVLALGLKHVEAGLDPERSPEIHEHRRYIRSVPLAERREYNLANLFARLHAPPMLEDLMRALADNPPDVVVRESLELGGLVFAEAQGVPHASVEVGALFAHERFRPTLAPRLDALRATVGLEPNPELSALYRYLHLSFVPPSYQEPDAPLPPATRTLRHPDAERVTSPSPPEWLEGLPARPTVYATLGTEIPHREGLYPGPFLAILEALRNEPVNVVLTVGRQPGPEVLSGAPENARVGAFLPQALVLPHCDLVVAHAGHGTVMAALAHGLPMVLLPFIADQPDNARRCARLGVAEVITPDELTPERLRTAVREVLGNPSFRMKAEGLRAEMEALPPASWAIDLLEALAEGRPLPTGP